MTSWAQNKSIQHSFNAKVSFPLVLSYALCSLLSQPTPIMLAFFTQDSNNMLEHALCLLGTSFQQVPYLLPKSFQWAPKIILPRFALSAPIIFFFFSQPSQSATNLRLTCTKHGVNMLVQSFQNILQMCSQSELYLL